ncbi:hypothetical protein C8R47DRAFT_954146, partial [Mycena vitilis]
STQISVLLDMPLRVVQRVRQVWSEIGEVARDRTRAGRSPLMSRETVDMMLGLLEHSPDMYLDEIQDQLSVLHGLDVSLSTITRTLRRLGMTSKKLSKPAAERCDESRRIFAFEVGQYPAEYLVTADEAAVNI